MIHLVFGFGLQFQHLLQVNDSRTIENLTKQGSSLLLELTVCLHHWRILRPGSTLLQYHRRLNTIASVPLSPQYHLRTRFLLLLSTPHLNFGIFKSNCIILLLFLMNTRRFADQLGDWIVLFYSSIILIFFTFDVRLVKSCNICQCFGGSADAVSLDSSSCTFSLLRRRPILTSLLTVVPLS